MSLQVCLAFVAACVALAMNTGPWLRCVIDNGLRYRLPRCAPDQRRRRPGRTATIMIGIVAIGSATLDSNHQGTDSTGCGLRCSLMVWLGIELDSFHDQEGVDADNRTSAARGGFSCRDFVPVIEPQVLVFLRSVRSAGSWTSEQRSFSRGSCCSASPS